MIIYKWLFTDDATVNVWIDRKVACNIIMIGRLK